MRLARLNCRGQSPASTESAHSRGTRSGAARRGIKRKTLRAKVLGGSQKTSGNSASSLAVFYVEQVALNRHVLSVASTRSEPRSPQPRGTIVYAREDGRSQILNFGRAALLCSSETRATAAVHLSLQCFLCGPHPPAICMDIKTKDLQNGQFVIH